MTTPDTQRRAGQRPPGSVGGPLPTDPARSPRRTPGATGVHDAAADAAHGTRVHGPSPSSALRPIWATLTAEERACIVEHQGLWKRLVNGSDHQWTYGAYSGFFESLPTILYGEDAPADLRKESPFTIIDRVYSKLCQYEYDLIDEELKDAFEDQSKANRVRPAWRYYRMLRAGFVKEGLTYPYEAINHVDPDVKFLGKVAWKGLQKDFAALLAKVEQRVDAEGARQQILSGMTLKHWGGFVPRFIAGTDVISKHSIGLAIDLEYPSNPHIKGAVATAIDAIMDHLATRGTIVKGRIRQLFKGYGEVSMEDYARLKEISDALVVFLREWLPKWEGLIEREGQLATSSMPESEWSAVDRERQRHMADGPAMGLITRLVDAWGGIEKARFFAAKGIVTLDIALFRAMKAEGVESGIEWKSHKDVMHFELPVSVKRWAEKKGFTKTAD